MKLQRLGQFFINSTKLQLLCLSLLVFCAYANTLQNDFAYDDKSFIKNWTTIKSIQNIPDLLRGDLPQDQGGVFRPVRGVFYVFSYHFFGTNPLGYHAQAILIHLINSILIYLIAYLISKKRIMAFICSTLFATHPIQTEAISFITASFDSIGITFFFLSFYFYLKAGEKGAKARLFYIGSISYAFLAFYTYEMTLVLPFLMMTYDFLFTKVQIKKYVPVFLTLVSYLCVRFLLLNIVSRADFMGESVLAAAKNARVEQLTILARYLKLLIFPQNLTIRYLVPHDLLDVVSSWGNGNLLTNLAIISPILPIIYYGLLGISIYLIFRHRPLVVFCVLWFLMTLLPVASIIPQGSVMAERYLYIPSFGFSLLAAFLIYKFVELGKRWQLNQIFTTAALCLIISLTAFYSLSTYIRNQDWKNSETIWLKAVAVNPDVASIKAGLALTYSQEGKSNLAIKTYQEAIALNSQEVSIYNALAQEYQKSGNFEMAIKTYQKSLETYPESKVALGNLALIYELKKQNNLAVEHYQKALNIDPKDSFLHYHLALNLDHQKLYAKAIEEYHQTIKYDPFFAQAYNQIGIIYAKTNRADLAEQAFKLCLEINPNLSDAHFNLAQIYELKGLTNYAIPEYQKGLEINPNQEIAKKKLELLLAKNPQY